MCAYDSRRPTVGSLLGVPIGSVPAAPPQVAAQQAGGPSEPEGPNWRVDRGEVSVGASASGTVFRPDGVEAVTYSNPFGQVMERVWFDRKVVYAVDLGELEVDPDRVKVAQEYQIVYSVKLDEASHLIGEPEMVPDQLNIYDTVPGMPGYSPIWQFNYVVVPRDYQANTLRSEQDCLSSGYPIRRSQVFEN
jgi:hypothetical protein